MGYQCGGLEVLKQPKNLPDHQKVIHHTRLKFETETAYGGNFKPSLSQTKKRVTVSLP